MRRWTGRIVDLRGRRRVIPRRPRRRETLEGGNTVNSAIVAPAQADPAAYICMPSSAAAACSRMNANERLPKTFRVSSHVRTKRALRALPTARRQAVHDRAAQCSLAVRSAPPHALWRKIRASIVRVRPRRRFRDPQGGCATVLRSRAGIAVSRQLPSPAISRSEILCLTDRRRLSELFRCRSVCAGQAERRHRTSTDGVHTDGWGSGPGHRRHLGEVCPRPRRDAVLDMYGAWEAFAGLEGAHRCCGRANLDFSRNAAIR